MKPAIYLKSCRVHRAAIASLLTALYLVFALSPLIPIARQAGFIDHSATSECTGDCVSCGCSLESRLSNTCCCSQKKMKLRAMQSTNGSSCCSPQQPIAAKQCCVLPQPVVDKKGDCCGTSRPQPVENESRTIGLAVDTDPALKFYKCGSPCGTAKTMDLLSFETNDLLPAINIYLLPSPSAEQLYRNHPPQQLPSGLKEPPDPPPKRQLFA